MHGLHLTADLRACACQPRLLTEAALLQGVSRSAVDRVGLTYVADKFFTFPASEGQPGGVTGTVLLAESHIALHTWPETASVTLDVYVCNFMQDNSDKAESLMRELVRQFQPGSETSNRLIRGEMPFESEQPESLLENLTEHVHFGIAASRRLLTERSAFQTIELFDTPQFGKLLRIDGANMTSERDEFFYHEGLIHPATTAHPTPRSALIIGGGDGGAVEEVLKHTSIERVLLIELDDAVTRVARAHLGNIHHGAFSDVRLEVQHADGAAYVEQSVEQFDLIFLDLTDPDTPARRLYQADFFRNVRNRLKPGGAMALHIGSPVFHPERFSRLVRELAEVFAIVSPYSLYVPLYGTQWGMAIASDTLDPLSLQASVADQRLTERHVNAREYYNGDVHLALFALPNYIRKLLLINPTKDTNHDPS
ncbi:MAG: polyamine aminopropyltransferase [Comamonadaceae bacterium]